MRYLLSLLLLTVQNLAQAQTVPKPESARYWAEKGGKLMASGWFSSAYSAFQLARSLGAPGMVPRMEEARRRNLNHILLQSLLAEARALTDADPAQAMRLLEHARRHFPDSSRILQEIGTLTNRPNFWPFNLKATQLWPSPTLHYVVASGNPARLYTCRGDSLTLLYSFAAPGEQVFFAPGDRLAWVATTSGTLLLDCQPTAVRVVSQLPDVMQGAVCSPDGRYMLASFANDGVNRLYRIRKGRLEKTDVVANPKQSIFPPDGRFLCLLATEGLTTVRQLYRLADDGPQVVRDSRAYPPLSDAAFSPDGRWLLLSFFDSKRDSLWAMTPDGPQVRHVFAREPEADASHVYRGVQWRAVRQFPGSKVDGLEQLGITLTPEEREAYLHLWHVVGAMMGIDEDLLSEDETECRNLMNAILAQQSGPSMEGAELTDACIELMRDRLIVGPLQRLTPYFVRFFVGDHYADMLKVDLADEAQESKVLEAVKWMDRKVRDTNEQHVLLGAMGRAFSHGMIGRILEFTNAAKSQQFYLPSALADEWEELAPDFRIPPTSLSICPLWSPRCLVSNRWRALPRILT
ncbi:MAG: DUF2236 domain-containing protein [Cytophagales bacterium]|nr:MAG: DUF2236 domain-containing protein [Cytophagales bacterium]